MLTRTDYEALEQKTLATYACRAAESQGRVISEPTDPNRTIFQRDRDRIIHSSAFRRLEYKTQVFVNHEGDYYRTRLTHSLEVAQFARSLSRTLQLNEDLAEGIALAHDLGHTPFGHSGEAAMHEMMQNHGGFEHNRQSFRVVTFIEECYPQFRGLNLSFEMREGIIKHSGEYDAPGDVDHFPKGFPSLEAQIVNLADEIAYTNHDLDDGLKIGMLTLPQLKAQPLWASLYAQATAAHPTASAKIRKHITIKLLMRACVDDVLKETMQRIQDRKICTVMDIRERGEYLASFSPEFSKQFKELKLFLFENLYRHYRVERMAAKAQHVVRELFQAFCNNTRMLPDEYSQRIADGIPTETCVCDYIAGMTDRYAFEEFSKLFDPKYTV